MGGRGASYRGSTGENPFAENYNGEIAGPDLYDDDTPTQRKNEIIDGLKEKNIIVMSSTDNIPDEIFLPNLNKIDKILSQYNLVQKDLENQDLKIRVHPGIKQSSTVAYFGFDPRNLTKSQIGFTSHTIKKSKQEIESTTKYCVKEGHWQDCRSDDYLTYPFAHEAGHYVEYIIAKNYIVKNSKQYITDYNLTFKLLCSKIRKEIFKIHNERFGEVNQNLISKYGRKNSAEFFAESFANLHCSDKPTTLAKSLDIFLRKGGKF